MRRLILMLAFSMIPQPSMAQETGRLDVANSIYSDLLRSKAQVFAKALSDPVLVVRPNGSTKNVSPGALDLLFTRDDGMSGRMISFKCLEVSDVLVSCSAYRAFYKQNRRFRLDFEFVGKAITQVKLFSPEDVGVNG